MTKIDSRAIFAIGCAFMVAISLTEPEIFGDENNFLDDFVNHGFLNFIGVVVTITLASTANIHIELRKKEKEAQEEFLTGTKAAVKRSAYSLIWALLMAVILVVAKPVVPQSPVAISLVNSLALAVILWGIFVIWDITKLAFRM